MSELRVGFVAGVTPDKWAGRWRERMSRPLVMVPTDHALAGVRDGSLHLALVRLPIDREGLHQIVLYAEQPVVVVGLEHPVAAYDEIAVEELAGEHRHDVAEIGAHDAVEAVAAGTGVVLLPASVARLHHRKDVTARPVTGVPETEVALVWRVEEDDPDLDTFIGIVRGRRATSSRGAPPDGAAPPTRTSAKKPRPAQAAAPQRSGRGRAPAPARGRPRRPKRRG